MALINNYVPYLVFMEWDVL